MIEIIVLIFVINWFSKTAKGLGKNPRTWGLIAFLSYVLPILIISFIVFPSIIIGWINKDNEITYQLLLFPINLIFGLSGIKIAKEFLIQGHLDEFKSKKKKLFIGISILVSILIILIYGSFKYKIKHNDNIIELKNFSGVQKLENGMYRDAIIDFNEFLLKYPNENTVYYNRGTAYLKIGLYDSAIIDFKKVIFLNKFENSTEHFRTYKFIAQCYQAINQPDSAIQYIKSAHFLMPENEKLTILLLDLYRQVDDSMQFCTLVKDIDLNAIQATIPDSVIIYVYDKCK